MGKSRNFRHFYDELYVGDADSDGEGKVLADGQERVEGSSRGPFGDEIKILTITGTAD